MFYPFLGTCEALSFSPGGEFVLATVACAMSRETIIFDAKGVRHGCFEHTEPAATFAWAPDGHHIAAVNGSLDCIEIRDVRDGSSYALELPPLEDWDLSDISSMSWGKTGLAVCCYSYEGYVTRVLPLKEKRKGNKLVYRAGPDIRKKKEVRLFGWFGSYLLLLQQEDLLVATPRLEVLGKRSFDYSYTPWQYAIHAQKRKLAIVRNQRVELFSLSREGIKKRAVYEPEPEYRKKGARGYSSDFVSWSPDGKFIATCFGKDQSPHIYVWEVESGRTMAVIESHDRITSLSLGSALGWGGEGYVRIEESFLQDDKESSCL
ncbi:hypothetical protein EI42_04417 [Thermosporothrix hazakensis]|jgi:WD40 repeat protein|uniref:WD40 repeat protein n=2 Tax=Thermosporothrix TaxID=768650 RepID=A0A326UF14_THEHA|nr:hypothetical protein [Thermosporothrix hazakensis]PZW25365.1 hypothetical protein EI42_04417 [Thermosporothrix hazakensis]BBH87208.1 hypothetical protein KTC_19590 [Thermosporothrix sp. COM3]GCE50597.1 hypothetical protein KTH_54660 [Thermosporothrix hazakensis]